MMLMNFPVKHRSLALILQFKVNIQIFSIPLFLNLEFFDHNRKASIETSGLQVIIEPNITKPRKAMIKRIIVSAPISFHFFLALQESKILSKKPNLATRPQSSEKKGKKTTSRHLVLPSSFRIVLKVTFRLIRLSSPS